MEELMKSISFPEESKTASNEMSVFIDNVVSSLQSSSSDDINQFFREINARLYNRFDAVKKSQQFRDLPQGKLRTKIRRCISLCYVMFFSGLTMTVTALKCEASKYPSKSISILIDPGYRVFVNGSLAEKCLTQFHDNEQTKFQYFGKKNYETETETHK